MSPEKTRKRNERPEQAVRRERRRVKQKLSAEVLSQTRVAMARAMITALTFENALETETDEEMANMLAANPRLHRDIVCA